MSYGWNLNEPTGSSFDRSTLMTVSGSWMGTYAVLSSAVGTAALSVASVVATSFDAASYWLVKDESSLDASAVGSRGMSTENIERPSRLSRRLCMGSFPRGWGLPHP